MDPLFLMSPVVLYIHRFRILDSYNRDWQTIHLANHQTTTSFTIYRLLPKTNYTFMLMARDRMGVEHFSEEITVATKGLTFYIHFSIQVVFMRGAVQLLLSPTEMYSPRRFYCKYNIVVILAIAGLPLAMPHFIFRCRLISAV